MQAWMKRSMLRLSLGIGLSRSQAGSSAVFTPPVNDLLGWASDTLGYGGDEISY